MTGILHVYIGLFVKLQKNMKQPRIRAPVETILMQQKLQQPRNKKFESVLQPRKCAL